MKKNMNKRKIMPKRKIIAALSVAALVTAIISGGNAMKNLFQIRTADAMIFKGNEKDVLGSDISSPICDVNGNQSAGDVAVNDNRLYTLVWEDNGCDGPGNGTGVYMQRYDTQNGPSPSSGGPVRISGTVTGDQKNPSVAMDREGDFVVAWEGGGNEDPNGIYVRAFKKDGTPITEEKLVNTHTAGVQDSPKIAMDFDTGVSNGETGHFAVVWHGEGDGDTEGVFMQRFDSDFRTNVTAVGTNLLVNAYTEGSQKDPGVAMNDFGETVVTWSGPGNAYPSSDEVWMQGYDSNNQPWGGSLNNIKVNSTSPAVKPSIASDKSSEPETNTVMGGKFIVAYQAGGNGEINGKLIDRCDAGGCQMGNVELNFSNGAGTDPDVAMDYMGNFTVTWEQDDTAAGENVNIHAINYDYLGHRTDNAFRVNDNTYGDGGANQTNASVAKDKDGEYFIAWTSPHTTRGTDIRYKNFGTDIFKQGTETLASPGLTLSGSGVSTAIAPNNEHAVVSAAQDNASGQTRIFYSLYDANNNIIVENQKADTVNNSSVGNPAVAFFKDTQGSGVGRFVIVWTGTSPDGTVSGTQVLYREFDSSGTAATPAELTVNAPTDGAGYSGTNVSAGYYNDGSSIITSVIDRFAISYRKTSGTPVQTQTMSAYHTRDGFTENILDSCASSSGCNPTSNTVSVDMYPDAKGNDKIVYTWDQTITSGSTNFYVYGREANGGTLSGEKFQINNVTNLSQNFPDVAFVSPAQYVFTWTSCDAGDCVHPNIMASRYAGNFIGGSPTNTGDNIVVYPGSAAENSGSYFSKIAADANSGTFLVVWTKNYADTGNTEIDGKFFEAQAGLTNFGIGFVISSTFNGNQNLPDADMNGAGRAAVSWEGAYIPFGINVNNDGAVFQMIKNPTYVETLPELPTAAQITITQGGKTLTIPSHIDFPIIQASPSRETEVERHIDENPASGQPGYFQLEDLGGNSGSCSPGPCYSVTINSTDFTFTDQATNQTYTIPASNIYIKNYDDDHAGIVSNGNCGTPEATESFIALFGNASDFSLDPSTCDYASLNTQRTLINKISNTSDTAKILWFPEFKIKIPALTPPGIYTGTITVTSA